MKKILIISANYYMKISSEMSRETINTLDNSKSLDGKKKNFKYEIINVPGVFEIPVIISKNIKKYAHLELSFPQPSSFNWNAVCKNNFKKFLLKKDLLTRRIAANIKFTIVGFM